MPTTVEAIYERGTLKLQGPVSLPENSRVVITIHDPTVPRDEPEARAWRKLSERALSRVWDNIDEDVFNRLRKE